MITKEIEDRDRARIASEPEIAAQMFAPNANPGAARLKVLFVTEEDPLYVIRFFDSFFAEYPHDELEICGITIDRAFREPIGKTFRRMYGFYGPWQVLRLGFRFIGARLRGRSIKALACAAGVPIAPTSSVNAKDYIERIRSMAPDVVVSVAAPEIFRREFLSVPRLGCINIHCGRLPAYRGMMPTFWQMLKGEPAITITIHAMAEKLDAGDILATHTFAIKQHDSLDRIITGTKRQSATLLLRVLHDIRTGHVQRTPMDMRKAGYFSFPSRKDVREFHKRGHRLL